MDSYLGVLSHQIPLIFCERTGLAKNHIRDAYLADVVQECSSAYRKKDLVIGNSESAAQNRGVVCDPERVLLRFHVSHLKRGPERQNSLIVDRFDPAQSLAKRLCARLDHRLEVSAVVLDFQLEFSLLERSRNRLENRLNVEWFDQIVVRTAFEGQPYRVKLVDRRDHYDGEVCIQIQKTMEGIDPATAGHSDIQESNAGFLCISNGDSGGAVGGGRSLVATSQERFGKEFTNRGIVIDHENPSVIHLYAPPGSDQAGHARRQE